MMRDVIETLKARGFIDAITNEEELYKESGPVKVYCGFDPTADSLHLGNLAPIIGLAWFQKFGHTPVAIVGGATGMIGDPSGKQHERCLLDEETLEKNLKGIKRNLETILDASHPTAPPLILNNHDWFKAFNVIDFLRDVGKHFRIGPMLAKESVRARFQSEEGMSFTEFSYQLLQGYDFLHLYKTHGVTVQLGGSDQWGNITAGKDLIRKVSDGACYGITFPLITRQDGQKFGKSEKGAIWLSPEKLSPYEFYQHLYRVADADVIMLMRMLTFMEMDEIKRLESAMQRSDYLPNTAQKRLAEEVTQIVHGKSALQTAIRTTEGAKPGACTELSVDVLEAIAKEMPSCTLPYADIVGKSLVELMVAAKLLSSKGEARRLIKGGGVYLNNVRIDSETAQVTKDQIVGNKYLLLALGKKSKTVICLIN